MAKKRASGEGNIRKRKDGRWEGRYTAGHDPRTGKRITKNVLGKTQAEVREKLKTAIAEAEQVDVARAGEYTVAVWLKTWYELYSKPNVRYSTAEYYRRSIEQHVIPRIGNIKLSRLTGRDLQKLYKTIGKAVDLSPKTVKKYVGELVDKGLIATENTSIITRDGMKRNGSLRYTILPVQKVVAEKMKHDMDRLSQDTARYEAQKKLAAASLIPAENTDVF